MNNNDLGRVGDADRAFVGCADGAASASPPEASIPSREDAMAQALCLLDSFAGDGLAHIYGNGQIIDASDACTELAEAFGVPCEPGWWRTIASMATIATEGENQ